MSPAREPRDESPRLGEALDLIRRLWTLNHELERLSARMSRDLGITAQQRMVLRIVGRFPGITPGRLSSLLCVDAATVSTALTRLERRKLVAREPDPRDRRRVAVALTAEGRALDIPTTGAVEAAVEAALAEVGPKQARIADRVLDALAEALRDQREGSGPSPVGPPAPRRSRIGR